MDHQRTAGLTHGRRLPLATWGASAGFAGGALVAAAVTGALVMTAQLDARSLLLTAVLGGTAVAAVTAAAALGAARGGRALRAIGEVALSREPGGSAVRLRSAEFADLLAAIEALHVRIRVADDLAARYRRDAETASAGMFELLSGLVAAEEGTRGQLAAELHDTVAQSLSGARRWLADGEPGRAGEALAEAEEQTRDVLARTRPAALRDGSLADAVRDLAADLEHRFGLSVTLNWPEEQRRLPLVTAVTLFRFFQETLRNVAHHCDEAAATARLELHPDRVVGRVEDDGPGFDPAAVRPERGRHVGLGLLRERARLAGGRLQVRSGPGRGTTVTLELPLPHPAPTPPASLIPAGRLAEWPARSPVAGTSNRAGTMQRRDPLGG